jgi:NAD(P)-dependent dehydrogenase (short-subunit alcohol dehydrogenase family)
MSSSRRIVVTGVSRGLGAALTAQFTRLGHQVLGCARNADQVRELNRRYGAPHHFAAVDVGDEAQVAQWARQLLDEHGAPDLLLNNAAIINPNANLWETDSQTFSQVVDVNIKGVFYVIRHFVPAMIERGSGVIVNFSSGWGRATSPRVAPYCATKWAVEGLTRALADELPYGLAAIPLNPGVIHTEMLESCFGPGAAGYPSPERWAQKAAPFLLELSSDDNGDPLTAPT